MDRVFLGTGASRSVKQFRHVLVPPAYAQQHAMRMHLGHQHAPHEPYDRAVTENAGDVFAVEERVADEPFMEELRGMDLFNSVEQHCRTGQASPWQCVATISHGSVVSTQR